MEFVWDPKQNCYYCRGSGHEKGEYGSEIVGFGGRRLPCSFCDGLRGVFADCHVEVGDLKIYALVLFDKPKRKWMWGVAESGRNDSWRGVPHDEEHASHRGHEDSATEAKAAAEAELEARIDEYIRDGY